MNEQNNIKIVNPLNPDEVIRVENYTHQDNKQEEIEETIEQPITEVINEEKPKKKFNFIILIIILLVLIIAGVSIYFFLIKDNNETPVIPNKPEIEIPEVNEPEVKVLTLEQISTGFAESVLLHPIVENSTTTYNLVESKLRVFVATEEETFGYEYTLEENSLKTILAKDDILGKNILINIFSSIAKLQGIEYEHAYLYFENNFDNLNISSVEIIDYEQTKGISIKLDEIMVLQ